MDTSKEKGIISEAAKRIRKDPSAGPMDRRGVLEKASTAVGEVARQNFNGVSSLLGGPNMSQRESWLGKWERDGSHGESGLPPSKRPKG